MLHFVLKGHFWEVPCAVSAMFDWRLWAETRRKLTAAGVSGGASRENMTGFIEGMKRV